MAHAANFSGATMLITGATNGIGLALARMLAAAGARLVLVGRRLSAELDAGFFTEERYYGHFIYINSIVANLPVADYAVYGATKVALAEWGMRRMILDNYHESTHLTLGGTRRSITNAVRKVEL